MCSTPVTATGTDTGMALGIALATVIVLTIPRVTSRIAAIADPFGSN